MKYACWLPLLFTLCMLSASVGHAGEPYDFRDTEAYRALAPADRDALEQVHRDLHLLWGALDRYADEHGGAPPETLDGLVPRTLLRLPRDPFAGAGADPVYSYRRGAKGNRAWCLASAGLPEFPYLAARGNVGLYVCKGVWLSGVNPTLGTVFDRPDLSGVEIRRRKVQSMANLRTLALLLLEQSLRKRFPPYSGKNFVLSLVARRAVDPANPRDLAVLFSPGDAKRSLPSTPPDAFLEITLQSLKSGADFAHLTSYAGRRNADRDYVLTPSALKRVVPILADLSFPGFVLIAYSDGSVKELTRGQLGLAPGDEPIRVGDDAEVELLEGLSDR